MTNTINGTAGNDTLTGTSGDDAIYGLDGNDTLIVTTGTNTLSGGDGNDTINDSGVSSTIDGGAGTDTLTLDRHSLAVDCSSSFTPGASTSTNFSDIHAGTVISTIKNIENLNLLTGSGNDSLSFSGLYFGDGFVTTWDGGAGDDLLTFSVYSATPGITANWSGANYIISNGTGSVVQVVNVERFNIAGGYGNDSFVGGNGIDFLNGQQGTNTISGGDGDDYLSDSGTNSTVLGGNGNDSFYIGGTGTTVDGGAGNDNVMLIYSGSTPVSFTFTPGISSAQTWFNGITVQNVEWLNLTTGSSDDCITFNGDLHYLDLISRNTWYGGAGDDTAIIDLSTGTASYSAGFSGPYDVHDRDHLFNPLVNLYDVEKVNITGGSGADIFEGMGENDVLNGGAGDDWLRGAAGNDALDGGAGNDTLDGGAGIDTASYANATGGVTVSLVIATAQSVGGGQGSDTLSGIENLTGSAFADTLTGDSGANVLTGNAGDDTLIGGAGNDTAGYANATGGVTVSLAVTTAQSVGGGQGSDTLSGIENLTGSSFADALTGDSGVNVLTGNAGDDSLIGGAGNDTLDGGAGNDTLSGGDDEDKLTGGAGDDTLDGGSSVDTAVVSGNRSAYTITQTSTGKFTVTGPDGTDTLTNVEYLKFDDQTMRLLPGTGSTVNFSADPSTYMAGIRDFDGNDVGGAASWKLIGSADVNGDGRAEHILFNRTIGRWAEVGTEADGLTYFANNGWAGDTRVVGIYIDPLVANGTVVRGSDTDSQRRFQNDLMIDNIKSVLGQADYNHDGLQEVYFSLTDGTAYLHAYMHADGNIQYANYQSKQQVIDYLTANGVSSATWSTWFPAAQAAPETLSSMTTSSSSAAMLAMGG